MIDAQAARRGVFHIGGPHTSYLFRVSRYGHLEHVYWGPSVATSDADALAVKPPTDGYQVAYADDDATYSLDVLPQEWSGLGKGDYRMPAAELKMPDGSFTTDFRYVDYEVTDGVAPCQDGLPSAHESKHPATTLRIGLADGDVALDLYYTVFACCDVVVRRAVLRNGSGEPVVIRRLMSQLVDLPNRAYDLVTFDGTWAAEAHRHVRPLAPGTYVNESLTGFSSNRHNPAVILATRGASEDHGECFAFNLVYSGNHHTAVELSRRNFVRVVSGINPVGFEWTLAPGEQFETPEAVLAYSRDGFDGLSGVLHAFTRDHILPQDWAEADRPVVVNTWESAMFDVNERTVLAQARAGKRVGAELVVLDDGWFTGRQSDHAGLGDYGVDAKKFPHGLGWLGQRVREQGMRFGIWVEPEMVNPDSALYREHPDWAITAPGRQPSLHRHQLVLDVSREDVRDYLVEKVSAVIDESGAEYVKWDCNRNLTDVPAGDLPHRYILGLYDVLRRIFGPRPHVLLESCASGGNRFDLGMLCFSPQIWASDCTDPVERLAIQDGLSHCYPPSTMGAHVTASPSQQTLRATPLSTRFNVAAFGVLGYEFDLATLSFAGRRDVAAQIAFYKAHRHTLQHGRFRRVPATSPDHVVWTAAGALETVVGHYQTRTRASQPPGVLAIPVLEPTRRYRVTSRPQTIGLDELGHLLAFVLPRWLNPEGVLVRTASRFYRLPDAAETYEATGVALATLAPLPQFEGTADRAHTRLWGDHGSTLYVVEPAS